MSEQAKRSVQARCEDISLVARAAFWLYGVYVLVLLGIGIWMMTQSADQFSLHVTQTQNGVIGQGFFRNMLEIDFSRSSLRADAVQQAKLAYLIGFFTAWIAKVLFCGIFVSGVQHFPQHCTGTDAFCPEKLSGIAADRCFDSGD